ncbi:hypothetical protein BKA70DRAFT_1437317 [Coprinopsis sp. MPI-PUGE-AT-0042]|nr:hypothetical protein BKA70DRAFT_1437317 [Coprinopsis sp. MPI-PUGE-AT-0042]
MSVCLHLVKVPRHLSHSSLLIFTLHFHCTKALLQSHLNNSIMPLYDLDSGTVACHSKPACLQTSSEHPLSKGAFKLTFESVERLNSTSYSDEAFGIFQDASVLLLDLSPPHGQSTIGPTFYRFTRILLQRDKSGSYLHLPNLATLLIYVPRDCWGSMSEGEIQGLHNVLTFIHNDHLAAKAKGLQARPLLQLTFPSQGELWQKSYCDEPTEQ